MTTDLVSAWPRTERVASGVTVLDEVASTNTWSMERGLEPYWVVLTWNQTRGRGRWDRAWISRPGESLALSVVFPTDWTHGNHDIPASWIPLVAGTCAVRSIRNLGVAEVGAKWPNDLVHQGKKLAGILTEFDTRRQPIIGLGLNIRFEGERPAPRAVSLHELLHLEPGSLDSFVSEFITELKKCEGLSTEALSERVRETLVTLGKPVTVAPPGGEPWDGIAEGLDGYGALLVRDVHGQMHAQSASDVEHLYQ